MKWREGTDEYGNSVYHYGKLSVKHQLRDNTKCFCVYNETIYIQSFKSQDEAKVFAEKLACPKIYFNETELRFIRAIVGNIPVNSNDFCAVTGNSIIKKIEETVKIHPDNWPNDIVITSTGNFSRSLTEESLYV